jgi:hypothetical protein
MSIDLQLHKVFTETYATLPSAVRSKIESLWARHSVLRDGESFIPAVFKEPVLKKRDRCAGTEGVLFFFKSSVVDQAPEDILKILIAHELAHAHTAAELGMPLDQAEACGLISPDKEEAAANKLMKEWGFDHAKLIRWLQQNERTLGLTQSTDLV